MAKKKEEVGARTPMSLVTGNSENFFVTKEVKPIKYKLVKRDGVWENVPVNE